MPAKNSVKVYIENGFYHIYNRGVEERIIFTDKQDYTVFLHYLKRYLSPPEKPNEVGPRWKFDLYEKIRLLAYCLMPNHFHLLIKQFPANGITEFMRALTNAYTRYFNEKHERIGHLFQGRYKAILVDTEPYLLHLSRYIHLNPIGLNEVQPGKLVEYPFEYPYSSYADYLRKRNTKWLHPEEILAFFKFEKAKRTMPPNILTYKAFVEDYTVDSGSILDNLTLD
ncbi:MAG: transposase [Candidatus Cloacimonetes bacterium]|nr:transposase [Candidatus Cloacimonadota bacterium]